MSSDKQTPQELSESRVGEEVVLPTPAPTSQRTQYPLIKGYTLNLNIKASII